MKARAKRLPRLWCALQGLLPLEACLAAQRAELALPPEPATPGHREGVIEPRNPIAAGSDSRDFHRRGSL